MSTLRVRAVSGVAALAPWLALSACVGGTSSPSDDGPNMDRGNLTVTTSTTGTSLDSDGYVVSLEEARTQPIDVNGVVTFDTLTAGIWPVSLTQVASNCVVAGANPASVEVRVTIPNEHHFDITCS